MSLFLNVKCCQIATRCQNAWYVSLEINIRGCAQATLKMTQLSQTSKCKLLAIVLCAIELGGCALCRVPQIDPTGQCIFTPYSTTTLENPCASCCLFYCCPQPAFTAPPTPPPCPPTATVGPTIVTPGPAVQQPCNACPPKKHCSVATVDNRAGHITLNPTKIIAPINGEVVLIAGLAGPQGQYVTNEPLRWILSAGSIGHFIEVGDEAGSHFHLCSKHADKSPHLVTGEYAVSKTSSRRTVITRGTPSPVDDIQILKGQTWVSVSSPREGTSYVTVVAPEAKIWDHRRQTATIHWVDAEWRFPDVAIKRAGEPHVLTTKVTRSSGDLLPAGWFVRYEILNPPSATFPANGQTEIMVPLDPTGNASVELISPRTLSGTSQVRVQIIRAAQDDAPRMIVGEGMSHVKWSSAGLAIQLSGPAMVAAGSTMPYKIIVANTGDITTRNVIASVALPPGVSMLNSTPPEQAFGDRFKWNLGDLPPQTQTEINFNCRADSPINFRLTATAESEPDALRSDATVDTNVIQRALRVLVEGPDTALVGETIEYRVRVINDGSIPMNNVRVRDQFDAGLEHTDQKFGNTIDRLLGTLQPGEEKRFAVTFIVRQPGKWCHTLDVSDDSGQTQSIRKCVTGIQPAAPTVPAPAPTPAANPSINVRKTGHVQRRVGEVAEFTITITNTGNVPLTNVRVVDAYDPALNPTLATDGFDKNEITFGRMVWTYARLEPGQTIDPPLRVNCQCRQAGNARSQVVVTTDQNLRETAEMFTQILLAAIQDPPGMAAPPNGTRPAPIPATGNLTVSVVDLDEGVEVGSPVRYEIRIKNDRTESDRNVVIRIVIPEGMAFKKITWDPQNRGAAAPVQPRFSNDRRTVELPEIREIRAGETLPPYRLEVTTQRPGRFALRVEVTSLKSPEPVIQSEDTMVFPSE